jgi:colanic acid/amylovoran biosynthesis glycosyltransferase
MKIIIFDGTFKTTTFINRLIEGISMNHDVFVIGFEESIKKKLDNVTYIGLGSNSSKLLFIKRSILLRRFKLLKQFTLLILLLRGNKQQIKEKNLQVAIDLIQPDILHFQWVSVLSFYKNMKLPKQTKTVFSQRGFHINIRPFINSVNSQFLKEIFPEIDGFHSVSKAIREKSKDIYCSESKIDLVVYSGIDYKNIPVKLSSKLSDVIQILSVGRNHWVKNYKSSMNAMAFLQNKNIKFHYTIIGVQEDEELLFMRSDLGLTTHVSFVSNISQQEVYRRMVASDLFLLPSIEEGIANVCIEAMFCGLPVLTTNCGGMSELIDDNKTGFIVPTRSPKSIANKIEEIKNISNTELKKITIKAREKVEKQHNANKMIADMETLYKRVYAKN